MKKKRGFTIIELVIVIAVIAILSGILIPTFIGLNKSAKMSKDLITLSNINKVYTVDKLEKSGKNSKTMHEALNEIYDHGFTLDSVQHPSTSDTTIAWDRVNDTFVLVNTQDGTYKDGKQNLPISNKSDYFVVYDEIPEDPEFSVYLTNKNIIGEISHIEVGLDSGDNYSVTKVVYNRSEADSKRDVIFRTNPGTDTEFYGYVNAETGEGDSIYHYGESGDAIIDCAKGSFYEYGASNNVDVRKGHFVQEDDSFVSFIDASALNGDVKIDFKNGSIHGTSTNSNTQHRVQINTEDNVKALNADYAFHGGGLEVSYAKKPEYSNQIDRNETIDGKPFVIEGIGNQGIQERELPNFTEFCESAGHEYISKPGYTLKVCERCGSFENTVLRTTESNNEVNETTYLHRHDGESSENGFIQINNSPTHEHHYSIPVWSWVGYTSAVARVTCEGSDCGENISFTLDGDDIERVEVTKENCTQDGIYDHVATFNFEDHEYTSTSPNQEIVEKLGHQLVHHDKLDPTCTEHGHKAYDECTREGCDYTTYEECPATGHTAAQAVQENVIPSTCTSEGSYDSVVYCSTCGTELSRETIHTDMLPHDGDPCSVCGYTEFTIKLLHTDKYTYKVGTDGAVPVTHLFDHLPASFTPEITTIRGNANASYSSSQFTFSGEGIARIKINTLSLELEVVNGAKNTTSNSLISASSNDVVLLNDVEVNNGYSGSVLTISNGYTFYGNGFNVNVKNDIGCNTIYSSFVNLENGILDNIQLEFRTYSKAILYSYQYSGLDVAYTSGNNIKYYYELANGICSKGNSTIQNSYIYGARSPVCASNGNLIIENTMLDGGSLANLVIGPSVETVTLNDIITNQEPRQPSKASNSPVVGLGILSLVDDSNNSAHITLNGTLTQYNWIDSSYSSYVPSIDYASAFISKIFSQTEYVHNIGGVNKVNEGIAFLNMEGKTISPSDKIVDNRSNGSSIPYNLKKLYDLLYVYSYNNSNGTDESFFEKETYLPNENMVTEPTLSVSNYDTDKQSFEKEFKNNKWVYTLTANETSTFSFNQVHIVKFGEHITTFNVYDSNNNLVDKNTIIDLNDVSTKNYEISANFEGKTFKYYYVIQSNISAIVINPPVLSTSNYGAGLCVATSQGGTWHGAAPALEGLVITYYSSSQKTHVNLNLSSLTPSTKGKQNGTNNTWIYSNSDSDFTLTLTGGQVHSKNNVYAMPVVCDSKLYFVASNSNGLVNTGNSARSVPVSYSFQANGDTLNFSHTWSVAEDQNNEYKYSDFCNGTLTKLSSSSSGGGNCLLPDTLITMADESKMMVKDVKAGDLLKVFNHETGTYDVSPVVFNDKEESQLQTVINLDFENGKSVGVVSEHGFFDMDLMRYVYITEDNYQDYVGHSFYAENGITTLSNAYLTEEVTEVYSPVTAVELNYFTNDMLSMPGGVEGIFNIFEYDADLKYNEEKMNEDIETYGLLDYSYYEGFLPYEVYVAFNGKYLGIAMGKGILTEEMLMSYVERYSQYW